MIKRFKWVEIGVLLMLGLSPLVQASPKHEPPRDKHSAVRVEHRSPGISHPPAAHQPSRYTHNDDRRYRPVVRVTAPRYGARFKQLPHGARPVWLHGVKYHRVQNKYYRWYGKQGYYQLVRLLRG